jgi:CDP-glucose 4,6-dehydratase
MHYLITGHTGFKGSWLSLILQMQGHTVSGISLKPLEKSLYNQAQLGGIFKNDLRLDIRNSKELISEVKKISPEVIIHLAAQPLVRESYKDPLGTFETNVLGTLNLLESTKKLGSVHSILVITTDKVYRNQNLNRGYIETDPLGGDDPYSASKASADIATQSWSKSYSSTPISIARAGNVIGGGDWGYDRIIPDLVNAASKGEALRLRYPMAIRPWQHVLDCLNGYLELVNHQLENNLSGEWNFGPPEDEKFTVAQLSTTFANSWGLKNLSWLNDSDLNLKETNYLLLDSSKARNLLGWCEKLTFQKSVDWTVEMYKSSKSPRQVMQDQIDTFFSL